ncbi:MAG: 2-phosphosulfolactate phosphatase, partial [Phycisphaerales bacterium]
MPNVSAALLPDHLAETDLTDRVAIVIDVLRATTTVTHALDEGASCVVPVASVDAARMISHEREGSLLCGERGGIRPDGFHLGNSPAEYLRAVVGGKDLVLTTTNGTRALGLCERASSVYVGALINLEAVAAAVRSAEQDVVLVCSGTDGRVSLEDVICAGLFASRLRPSHDLDDSAMGVMYAGEGAIDRCGGVEESISSSFHAGRLVDMGFGADV